MASFSMNFFNLRQSNTKCILFACFITSFPFTLQPGAEWWIFQFYCVFSESQKQRKDNNYLVRINKSETSNIGCVLSVDPMNVKWMERKTASLNFIWSFSSFSLPRMLSMTRYGVRNQQNVRTARFNENEIPWIHNVCFCSWGSSEFICKKDSNAMNWHPDERAQHTFWQIQKCDEWHFEETKLFVC